MKKTILLTLAGLTASLPYVAKAAEQIVPVAGTYSYSQNFNAMFMPTAAGNVATTAWTDNITIPNWYFHFAGAGTNPKNVFAGVAHAHNASSGSVAPSQTLNSMGAPNDPDRAFASPSTTARSEQSGIVIFQNTSDKAVDLKSLSFNGEVLRTNSTANNVETIFPYFKTANTRAELLTITQVAQTGAEAAVRFPAAVSTVPTAGDYVTGWTAIPEANFTYSNAAGAAVVNDSIPVNATGLAGIRVGPGKFIALRFSNINDGGTDGLIGMDDLSVTFEEVDAPVITPTVTNLMRNVNGTPVDPNDDLVTFDLTVSASPNNGPGWDITSALALTNSGTYGVPKSFSVPINQFTAAPHTLTGNVVDNLPSGATATFDVTAPWCTIVPTIDTFTYNDQGTLSSADDVLGYSASATGTFTGPNFTLTGGTTAGMAVNYGTPGLVSPTAGSVETIVFTDSADTACTASLVVNNSAMIGVNNAVSPAIPIISAPVFGTRLWTQDPAAMSLTQTANPGNANHTVDSLPINLSALGGVTINASLAATSGGTGFEAADRFQIFAIVDGGAPVSMLGAADTDGNGYLNGLDDGAGPGTELPSNDEPNITDNFSFSYTVPPSAQSLVIRIVGNSNSTGETLVVTGLAIETAPPSVLTTTATNIVRNENGPGAADDTVSFDTTLTSNNAGANWSTSTAGVTPATGAYGNVRFTVPAAGGGTFTVNLVDTTINNAIGSVAVAIPTRYVIGQTIFGVTTTDVNSLVSEVPNALWANNAAARTLTMTAGIATDSIVNSEVIDLSSVGEVTFTANFNIADTSNGSNIEAVDRFKAELILDEGTATEAIVNLVDSYDFGDGANSTAVATAGANGPKNGFINGYRGTAGTDLITSLVYATDLEEYNANKSRDEFNIANENGEASINNNFPLSFTIPAAVNTAKLRITGSGFATSETATVSEVLFINNDGGPTDTDMDGMPDAFEDANGLNKNSAADANTDLDGDGIGNLAEYNAGTAPNDANSALRIKDIVLNGANYDVSFASVSGKKYKLQGTLDVATGPWSDIAGATTTAAGATTTVSVPVSAVQNASGKGFVRIVHTD